MNRVVAMLQQEKLQNLKNIVLPIAQKYGLEAVYLFGSQARGEETPASDYDFYIRGGSLRGLFQLSGLLQDLKQALRSDVDIVLAPQKPEHGKIDAYLLDGIKKDGVLLYERGEGYSAIA